MLGGGVRRWLVDTRRGWVGWLKTLLLKEGVSSVDTGLTGSLVIGGCEIIGTDSTS